MRLHTIHYHLVQASQGDKPLPIAPAVRQQGKQRIQACASKASIHLVHVQLGQEHLHSMPLRSGMPALRRDEAQDLCACTCMLTVACQEQVLHTRRDRAEGQHAQQFACLEGLQGCALLILRDEPGIHAAAHCSFPVRRCSFHSA